MPRSASRRRRTSSRASRLSLPAGSPSDSSRRSSRFENERPARRFVLAQQRAEDPAGHALHDVLAVQEHRVVGLVVRDLEPPSPAGTGAARSSRRRVLARACPRAASAAARCAPSSRQRGLPGADERRHAFGLEVQHAEQVVAQQQRHGRGAAGASAAPASATSRGSGAAPVTACAIVRERCRLGCTTSRAAPPPCRSTRRRRDLGADRRGVVAGARRPRRAARPRRRARAGSCVPARAGRRAPRARRGRPPRRTHMPPAGGPRARAAPADRRAAAARPGADAEAGDALDVVDVGAAQPEHVAHARLRRDRIEVRPHRLERLALGLGVQVAQVERVLLAGLRDRRRSPARTGSRRGSPSTC